MVYNIEHLPWNLTPFYNSEAATDLEVDFSLATEKADHFRKKYIGTIESLNVVQMQMALTEFEDLHEVLVKPQTFAYLLFAANSEDDSIKRLSQRVTEFVNKLSQDLLFFDLEIIAMPDDHYMQLQADATLANYRHYMESLRRYRKHTLPEREERILKQKSLTGVEAFTRLFDELFSSFTYEFELEGEKLEMTGEELLGLLHHHDMEVREHAFSVFLAKFQEQATTFSAIFNNVALDHGQDLEIRGYQNVMDPTHLANELTTEVVEGLLSISENNYHLAQEYFRLKARLLGLPILKNTDIYAPLPGCDRRFSFAEAKDLVVESYGRFLPDLRDIIDRFFSDERIDTPPRSGKSGGAFCMGISPKLPPYILLNYTGNLRDVATLAHELGHGLHFSLAQRQSMLNYHPPLPLAETASVFGEMLLTRLMLERESDPKVKISLLCAKIEDIIATTFRQVVLTRFEERFHNERKKSLLTTSDLCNFWLEENARLYGDSVKMIEAYKWGWSYISHFVHSRFYCYSYTFAELLVLSLYSKYLTEGQLFIPKYISILESGGSLSPADTMRLAGINFAEPSFWQDGYDLLQKLLEELKTLI